MNEIAIPEPIAIDSIRSRILTVCGVQVMLDRDLAELYGVPTKVLNQAVKRNIERFPERFMFQLSKDDIENLRSQIATTNAETSIRSQIVTINKKQGQHLKYMPYVMSGRRLTFSARGVSRSLPSTSRISLTSWRRYDAERFNHEKKSDQMVSRVEHVERVEVLDIIGH
jgi:hypothetical protein